MSVWRLSGGVLPKIYLRFCANSTDCSWGKWEIQPPNFPVSSLLVLGSTGQDYGAEIHGLRHRMWAKKATTLYAALHVGLTLPNARRNSFFCCRIQWLIFNESEFYTRKLCYRKDVRAMHNPTIRTWFEARKSICIPSTLWGIKKHTKILLCITSRNINRFSKFFHCLTQEEICYKSVITYPTTP